MTRVLGVALAGIALLAFIPSAAGQAFDPGPIDAEVNVSVGLPLGDFDGGVDGEAIGLSAFIGGPVPDAPIVLGTEVGYMNYGSDGQLSLHSTVLNGGIDADLAIPVEAVATTASNNIFLGHFVARLQPQVGRIRPYVDGLAGVKYFDTRLRVDSDVIIFRRGLSQDVRLNDFALSYGAGGGIELMLYEHDTRWSERPARLSLHGGVRYLLGTTARYATGDVVTVDERLVVSEFESKTDLLLMHFGVRVHH